MTEQINDERVQAVVERIARAWADEGVKDCAVSPEGRARMWPDIYGMTAQSTARVLAALKAGDVLPGDGGERLVVVREGLLSPERAKELTRFYEMLAVQDWIAKPYKKAFTDTGKALGAIAATKETPHD